MNEIAFVVDDLQDHRRVLTVVPYVDGIDLRVSITEYERLRAFDPAGGYAGIVPEFFNFGDLADYYRGATDHSYWGKIGKIAVLGCECGEVGCWPLYAQVQASEETISWSVFEQPHRRERDYSEFGPFQFRRSQYESAVDAMKERLSADSGER